MAKKFFIMAISIVFLMQSVNVWSATLGSTIVYLYCKKTKKTEGTPRPSRAPANNNLCLCAYINMDKQQLVMQDCSGEVYAYCVYDERKNIVLQGLLDFSATNNIVINIGDCHDGIYSLSVVCKGNTFCGTFVVD